MEGRLKDCRGVPSQVRHYRARSSYETSGVEKPSLYQYASGVENTGLEIAVRLVDNDAALSLPSDRVFKLLGSAASQLLLDIQEWLYINAAALGSIALLKWARKNDCVMRAYACHMAARNGHLHALQWLRENGGPWDHQTIEAAAKHRSNPKHLGCLWYAVENKCPGWKAYTHLLALD